MRKLFLLSILLASLISNAQKDSSKNVGKAEDDIMPDLGGVPPPLKGPDVFTAVQQMPEFKGGEGAMMKFLAENLNYPDSAVKHNVEGKIRVKFTVTPTGEIKDAHVISKDKLGYGCEEAAIEVIMKMPKWNPGRQNGNAVYVYYNLPISFKLY